MASNGKPATAAYDAAIAAATPAEKKRLEALRLGFNIPPDSPEWQFYAVLAPLAGSMGEKERAALFGQLDRIESRVDGTARDPTSALGSAYSRHPQLDRIETRQNEFDSRLRSLDAHIRAGSTPGIAPLAVHIVALLMLLACVAVGYVARMMPTYGSILIIAVVAVLAYSYLAPLIAPSLAGALRKVVR